MSSFRDLVESMEGDWQRDCIKAEKEVIEKKVESSILQEINLKNETGEKDISLKVEAIPVCTYSQENRILTSEKCKNSFSRQNKISDAHISIKEEEIYQYNYSNSNETESVTSKKHENTLDIVKNKVSDEHTCTCISIKEAIPECTYSHENETVTSGKYKNNLDIRNEQSDEHITIKEEAIHEYNYDNEFETATSEKYIHTYTNSNCRTQIDTFPTQVIDQGQQLKDDKFHFVDPISEMESDYPSIIMNFHLNEYAVSSNYEDLKSNHKVTKHFENDEYIVKEEVVFPDMETTEETSPINRDNEICQNNLEKVTSNETFKVSNKRKYDNEASQNHSRVKGHLQSNIPTKLPPTRITPKDKQKEIKSSPESNVFLRCNICDETFQHRVQFQRHQRVHSPSRPFECSTCQRRFNQLGHLNSHMRTHSGEMPFQCKICGRKFTRKERLGTHMIRHTGEKPYTCPNCANTFKHFWDLRSHLRTNHSKDKLFECKKCHVCFANLSTFTAHWKTHS